MSNNIINSNIADDASNNFINNEILDSGKDGAIGHEMDHLVVDQQTGDIWDHQITFEIPSNLDLERIRNLDNFTSLMNRIPGIRSGGGSGGGSGGSLASGGIIGYDDLDINFANAINSDSVPQSVLEKWSNSVGGGTSGSDYQMVLNYLWIGVVTSLIIMSVVFIVFSCYFYRKFREWKKCNKDIRSQLPSDLYPNGSAHGMGDSNCLENGYYQMMESPPCYTIATGLPSYDEALLQAHHHFTFGMRMMECSWEKPHISESNYLWNDEGNTLDTTNSVVTANSTNPTTNTITTLNSSSSNNSINSNNNNNTSTIIVKEIGNFINSRTRINLSTPTDSSLEEDYNLNMDRREEVIQQNESKDQEYEDKNEVNNLPKDSDCIEIVVMS